MELKKNPKADLEKRRGLYLEIGLVTIMVLALAAFEWKSYDQEQIEVVQRTAMDEVEDVIIQTQQEELPPPPPPEQPEVTTELNVIEDDAESENEVDMSSFQRQEEATNIEITPVKIEEEEEEEEQTIFQVVENDPEFPGGVEAMYKYLAQNIKYPQLARENNITGRVYVTFVVERDGSVSGVRVLRDIGGGCGAEAVRVVKSMPKWTPGKQRGKAVRVQYNLPVNFSLH
jgi:protein TonB